ncbi:MAG TPA: gluconate 2-dehydrogenase subunit 3 family protein [Tepidisphaeraceae bacterium]|jgi:hypothetical protein|nr:gluconate 2-dehydrogenase subunit 3 family protein [Tepidisphaeraceae bacterium]
MLNPQQLSTLLAAMDRVIPSDEFPSASQAGGMTFIDRLFRTDLAHRTPELAALLDQIDAAAKSQHDRSFADLAEAQQDAALTAVEDSPSRKAFAWLVDIINEGYYADPANGGNADAVSWKMIGYAPRVPGYDGSQQVLGDTAHPRSLGESAR